MAELILDHIFKIYDKKVTAVKDFNLRVADKEFIVFVGPSGCGKSTTLRMIAGLEDISQGDLYIDGKRVNDVPPKDRDIAMVFQNYALYPHMSVYDNMAFGLKLRKTPKAEIKQRVNDAARILGLEELLNRKQEAEKKSRQSRRTFKNSPQPIPTRAWRRAPLETLYKQHTVVDDPGGDSWALRPGGDDREKKNGRARDAGSPGGQGTCLPHGADVRTGRPECGLCLRQSL